MRYAKQVPTRLAWPERQLYLEGNGFGFHALASDLDRDARRQNDLEAAGWLPIEIDWRTTDLEIAATVRRFLAAAQRLRTRATIGARAVKR